LRETPDFLLLVAVSTTLSSKLNRRNEHSAVLNEIGGAYTRAVTLSWLSDPYIAVAVGVAAACVLTPDVLGLWWIRVRRQVAA